MIISKIAPIILSIDKNPKNGKLNILAIISVIRPINVNGDNKEINIVFL